MNRTFSLRAAGGAAFLGVAACAATPSATKAPLFDNLGTHHFDVTTTSLQAQRYFDQGLRLVYAFNHAEAIRSFEETQRLDPDCAMAFWGVALALGPNINAPMDAAAAPNAHAAIEKAQSLAAPCTERERGLIDALSRRYVADAGAERAPLDAAYANAMRALADRHPNDADVGTLAVAAFMESRPWDYWSNVGEPRADTLDNVARLESILRAHPDHAGAIHFYIHLVEASNDPARAEDEADRLARQMPGAGHIVHMPSHIYFRVGRYADASASNVAAIAADESYLTECRRQGAYPSNYYPHNIHFLWAAATFEGRSAAASEAARKVDAKGAGCCGSSSLTTEDFASTPLFALVRFGKWQEILEEPRPKADAKYHTSMWHHARGVAHAALGRLEDARAELAALETLAKDEKLANESINFSPASDVLRIARNLVAARIAEQEQRVDEAIALLTEAVKLQDGLRYFEPPTWHYPVRQTLGATLMRAQKTQAAEIVYVEDLKRWPENGWSLFGLREALRAQGRDGDANAVDARLQKAWAAADVKLPASAF